MSAFINWYGVSLMKKIENVATTLQKISDTLFVNQKTVKYVYMYRHIVDLYVMWHGPDPCLVCLAEIIFA